MKIQTEICCGSYNDALQAEQGGALRIELNSALHMGGLTPSVSSLKLVKQHTQLSVMAMVRLVEEASVMRLQTLHSCWTKLKKCWKMERMVLYSAVCMRMEL